MTSFARTTEWQRQRAQLLHREFLALETAVSNGATVQREIEAISERLRDHVIEWTDAKGRVKSKPLKASVATLFRALLKWRDGGKTFGSILLDYHSAGHHTPVPPNLDLEIRTLATAASGGRNKDGLAPASFASRDLKRRWRAGESIPGLGTWRVSIHAPTRGATRRERGGGQAHRVSIHAPTRGATRWRAA